MFGYLLRGGEFIMVVIVGKIKGIRKRIIIKFCYY